MKRIKYSILAAAAALPAAAMFVASAGSPNLTTNPTFDTDLAGWSKFSSSTIAWENGALAVINNYQGNGNSYYSAQQCINGVQEGVQYTFSADAYVGVDQPLPNTRAVLYAYFYPNPDCTGQLMSAGEASGASTLDQRGQWITLSKTVTAPAGAKSFYFRPTSTKEPKPYASSIPDTFTVLFDNFYFGEVEAEEPEQPPVINDPDPEPEPEPEPQDDPVIEEPGDEPADDPNDDPKTEDEPGTPSEPENPGQPEEPSEPWEPQFPWEPPAPQVPDAPESPAPSEEPEPQQPQVEDQQPPAEEQTPEAPAPAPAAGTVDDPLPPATGDGLAERATSPWGALVMAVGLAFASLGAAALGATRRK